MSNSTTYIENNKLVSKDYKICIFIGEADEGDKISSPLGEITCVTRYFSDDFTKRYTVFKLNDKHYGYLESGWSISGRPADEWEDSDFVVGGPNSNYWLNYSQEEIDKRNLYFELVECSFEEVQRTVTEYETIFFD